LIRNRHTRSASVDRYRQRIADVLRDPKDISALTRNNKKDSKEETTKQSDDREQVAATSVLCLAFYAVLWTVEP